MIKIFSNRQLEWQPILLPWRFPGRQVTALTTHTHDLLLPVNPPTTYLPTDSRKVQHPSSTIRQHALVPVHCTGHLTLLVMPQHLALSIHQVDRADAFDKQPSSHHTTTTHPSANHSGTTSHIIRLSVSASPSPPSSLWSSTECSHGSPFCSHRGPPSPTDPHTGISKESQPILNNLPTYTSPTVPTPSISPTLQESADVTYIQLRDPPILLFPHANFAAIRENKFGSSGKSNQGLGGGSSTL